MEATAGGSIDVSNRELILAALRKLNETSNTPAGGEENPVGSVADDDLLDQELLAKLVSQIESMKADGTMTCEESSSATVPEETTCRSLSEEKVKALVEDDASDGVGTGAEEIVKELKKVRRQNTVTHWLLSALLVLTVVWQVSEVSVLLKLKNGFTHPFRSLGSMITGVIKGRVESRVPEKKQNLIDAPPPSLPVPVVPILDLPGLVTSDD